MSSLLYVDSNPTWPYRRERKSLQATPARRIKVGVQSLVILIAFCGAIEKNLRPLGMSFHDGLIALYRG